MIGGNNFAFIDNQNLNKSIRRQGWQLDYARFRVFLQEKYKVTKAFLFLGYLEKYQNLYSFLEECRYIIIFKPTILGPNGKPKGNVDAELVLHTMIQYPNFAEAIIVSGDGDFYCLVEYLDNNEKLAKLIIPNQH